MSEAAGILAYYVIKDFDGCDAATGSVLPIHGNVDGKFRVGVQVKYQGIVKRYIGRIRSICEVEKIAAASAGTVYQTGALPQVHAGYDAFVLIRPDPGFFAAEQGQG